MKDDTIYALASGGGRAGVAVVSTRTVRYKADGQELERIGFTYLLRKTNEGWKIAVLVGHDPANVLRLD